MKRALIVPLALLMHLTPPAPPPDGDPIGTDGWE